MNDDIKKYLIEEINSQEFDEYIVMLIKSNEDKMRRLSNCCPSDIVDAMLNGIDYEFKHAEDRDVEDDIIKKSKEYVISSIKKIIKK